MATTRPFAYNTGATISGCDQLGDLAIGEDAIRYDLQVGNVTWFMGPDEELGHVICLPVAAEYRPEFWRSAFSDSSFLSYVNYIDIRKGGTGVFTGATQAYNWLTAEGYWTSFTGATGDGFKVTIDTEVTAQSNSDQVTMPIYDGTSDVYIDWGDSSGLTTITTFPSYPVHTYDSAGVYEVTITGGLTQIRYAASNDALKVQSLDQWGDFSWSDANYMFGRCRNMVANYSDFPDTSAIENMSYMFYDCDDFNGVCNFDTTSVTTMANMFDGSHAFNNDISSFDTTTVETMANMFLAASVFNQSVNHFDTSACLTLTHMFMLANNFNQSVSNWDTSLCTHMDYLFYGTSFAQDLTNFDTHNVIDMHAMFLDCSTFNHDISSFNTQKVYRVSAMFHSCSIFNQTVSHFVTSGVTDMHQTFFECSAFDQSLSAWDTSSVDDMTQMFYNAIVFDSSISGWDTGNVENMSNMFQGAVDFNQPVNHFDLRKVISLGNMFYNADVFNQPVYDWITSGVTNFSQTFALCDAFEQTLSGFTIENATNMAGICTLTDINAVGTTINYDETLIAWESQSVLSGLSVTFTSAEYGEGLVDNGTTNGTTTDKLVDTTQNFSSTVTVDDVVHNTTDDTFAIVTNVDSNTTLSLSVDIMISGEVYRIQGSDAAKARAALVLDDLWTVNDGGAA